MESLSGHSCVARVVTRPNLTVANATRPSALLPAVLFVAAWLIWAVTTTSGVS